MLRCQLIPTRTTSRTPRSRANVIHVDHILTAIKTPLTQTTLAPGTYSGVSVLRSHETATRDVGRKAPQPLAGNFCTVSNRKVGRCPPAARSLLNNVKGRRLAVNCTRSRPRKHSIHTVTITIFVSN